MKLVKNYSLSLTLTALFFTSWLGQGVFQFQKYASDAKEHNQTVSLSEFYPEFLASTFENWQSEFLQLLAFVVLTTYLVHKNSPESRDSADRVEAKIDQIKRSVTNR